MEWVSRQTGEAGCLCPHHAPSPVVNCRMTWILGTNTWTRWEASFEGTVPKTRNEGRAAAGHCSCALHVSNTGEGVSLTICYFPCGWSCIMRPLGFLFFLFFNVILTILSFHEFQQLSVATTTLKSKIPQVTGNRESLNIARWYISQPELAWRLATLLNYFLWMCHA